MKFNKDLLRSLLWHFSLLFLLYYHGCIGGSGGHDEQTPKNQVKNPQENTQKIVPKEQKEDNKEEVSLVDPSELKSRLKHEKRVCPGGFFGGLGITLETHINGHEYVSSTVEGYPGQLIGLQYGDEIISPDYRQLVGEVGTEVKIVVLKNDGTIEKHTIVRDKICVENP